MKSDTSFDSCLYFFVHARPPVKLYQSLFCPHNALMCIVCECDKLGLETFLNQKTCGSTHHATMKVNAALGNTALKHYPVPLHTLAILRRAVCVAQLNGTRITCRFELRAGCCNECSSESYDLQITFQTRFSTKEW